MVNRFAWKPGAQVRIPAVPISFKFSDSKPRHAKPSEAKASKTEIQGMGRLQFIRVQTFVLGVVFKKSIHEFTSIHSFTKDSFGFNHLVKNCIFWNPNYFTVDLDDFILWTFVFLPFAYLPTKTTKNHRNSKVWSFMMGLRFRVSGLGFRIYGLGFRV